MTKGSAVAKGTKTTKGTQTAKSLERIPSADLPIRYCNPADYLPEGGEPDREPPIEIGRLGHTPRSVSYAALPSIVPTDFSFLGL